MTDISHAQRQHVLAGFSLSSIKNRIVPARVRDDGCMPATCLPIDHSTETLGDAAIHAGARTLSPLDFLQ